MIKARLFQFFIEREEDPLQNGMENEMFSKSNTFKGINSILMTKEQQLNEKYLSLSIVTTYSH